MRTPKRLRFLYKFFRKKKNFKMYLRDIVCLESKNEIEYWCEVFYEKFKDIKIFHKTNSHLRFSQVLQVYNLYKEGFWFHIEDDVMLMKFVNPREVLYWGNRYSKTNKLLKKVNYILIKDIDTEHIQSILDNNYTNNLVYLKTFEDELKLRENGNNIINNSNI